MNERLQAVVSLLKQRDFLSYAELARLCHVSEPTARRDAAKLVDMGLLETVYGGVRLAEYKNGVIPIDLRDGANSAVKEQLAHTAAERVHDGDTVFFDSSSTVRRICHHLHGRKDLTVITNNLRVLQDLKGTEFTVLCTGGSYYRRRDCFLGALAERFLENVNADLLFFSAQGISEDGRITDVSEEEVSMRRTMMAHAKKKIFLCDDSKFGVVKSLLQCTVSEVDEILCNRPLHFSEND